MKITCDLCEGLLMIHVGGKSAACVRCGMLHSIERVKEKLNDKTQDVIHKNSNTNKKTKEDEQIETLKQLLDENGFYGFEDLTSYDEMKNKTIECLLNDIDSYDVKFNDYGIKALDLMIIKESQLEKVRKLFERYKKNPLRTTVSIRVFATYRFENEWVAVVAPNQVLWEFGNIDESVANTITYEIKEIVGDSIAFTKNKDNIVKKQDFEDDTRINTHLKVKEVSNDDDFVLSTENLEEIDIGVVLEYKGKANKIIVPKNVGWFGQYQDGKPVFKYPETVEEVKFNDELDSIGSHAFKGCKNLKEIYIPNNIKYIGYSLDNNDLGNSHTFEGCTGLEKVRFHMNSWCDNDVCNTLFKGCKNLKEVKLPETITTITPSTFEDCESLEEIVIPDSVAIIGQNAFKNCKSLKNVILPSHPLAIHPTAFTNTLYTPPIEYTKVKDINKCPVCGKRLSFWNECKKCGRLIHFPRINNKW